MLWNISRFETRRSLISALAILSLIARSEIVAFTLKDKLLLAVKTNWKEKSHLIFFLFKNWLRKDRNV